jgi:hypothetical protein
MSFAARDTPDARMSSASAVPSQMEIDIAGALTRV